MRKSVESCIFCAPSPCSCNDTPSKKASKPKVTQTKKAPPVAETEPKPTADRPKLKVVQVQRQPEAPRRTGLSGVRASRRSVEPDLVEQDRDEADFARALTILFRSELIDWRDVQRDWASSNIQAHEARLLIWKLRVKQHKYERGGR